MLLLPWSVARTFINDPAPRAFLNLDVGHATAERTNPPCAASVKDVFFSNKTTDKTHRFV